MYALINDGASTTCRSGIRLCMSARIWNIISTKNENSNEDILRSNAMALHENPFVECYRTLKFSNKTTKKGTDNNNNNNQIIIVLLLFFVCSQ